MMEKNIYLEATGCNRRMLETEKFRRYLSANGYCICRRPEEGDYILFASCAFKKDTEDYSVRRIRQLRKHGKKLLVYGCLPSIAPQRYAEFDGVPCLAPKDLDQVDTFFDDIRIPFREVPNTHQLVSLTEESLWAAARRKWQWHELVRPGLHNRILSFLRKRAATRADPNAAPYYLQICRGCRGKCAYCAIPRAIGGVVSQPVQQILHEMREGYQRGVRRFVLLGDDPGCYGLDSGDDLPRLLQTLCQEADQLPAKGQNGRPVRFKIHGIHPKHLIAFVDDIVPLAAQGYVDEVVCSVQSGSDRVLQRMNREHTVAAYETATGKLRRANPKMFLSTQIIAGFPGESEQDFQQSIDLLARMRFDEVIIFAYADKVNTAASRMTGKISAPVIRKRVRRGIKQLRRHGIKAYHHCSD